MVLPHHLSPKEEIEFFGLFEWTSDSQLSRRATQCLIAKENRIGVGIILYVHNTLSNFSKTKTFTNVDTVIVEKKSSKAIVGLYYRPP